MTEGVPADGGSPSDNGSPRQDEASVALRASSPSSDALVRGLLQASPGYIALLDAEGRLVQLNRCPEGLTPAHFLGRLVTDFIPLEMVERITQLLRRIASTGIPEETVVTGIGPHGIPAQYECRLGPVAENGQFAGYVLFATDITEREHKDRELRVSEERLAEAQRIAGVGSWEWNLITGEVWWSDELYRIHSLDPSLFRPSYESFLEMVIPEDRALVQARLSATLERGEHYVLTYRANSRGETRVLSAQARLLRDRDGNPSRLVGTCQDVTEQRRIQMQLRRTERLASLGTLAAGIAHEINNPISAAWTAAETAKMLRGKPGSDLLFNECLDAVSDAVCRCQVIIENVLRFARQESSEKAPQELNDIVARAVETTRHYSQRHGATVELDLTEKLPQPSMNGPEIEQVLVNLIRNAVLSGSSTRVVVSTESGFQWVRVRISDNGRGIPQADLDKIFDPFFTSDGQSRGTGLGLAISHAIVEDHHGTIEVESQLGVGSMFTVSLPLATPKSLRTPPRVRRGRRWFDSGG